MHLPVPMCLSVYAFMLIHIIYVYIHKSMYSRTYTNINTYIYT